MWGGCHPPTEGRLRGVLGSQCRETSGGQEPHPCFLLPASLWPLHRQTLRLPCPHWRGGGGRGFGHVTCDDVVDPARGCIGNPCAWRVSHSVGWRPRYPLPPPPLSLTHPAPRDGEVADTEVCSETSASLSANHRPGQHQCGAHCGRSEGGPLVTVCWCW